MVSDDHDGTPRLNSLTHERAGKYDDSSSPRLASAKGWTKRIYPTPRKSFREKTSESEQRDFIACFVPLTSNKNLVLACELHTGPPLIPGVYRSLYPGRPVCSPSRYHSRCQDHPSSCSPLPRSSTFLYLPYSPSSSFFLSPPPAEEMSFTRASLYCREDPGNPVV